jgi:hypothetical protein
MSQYPAYPPPLPPGFILPPRRPRRWVRVVLALVIFFGGMAVGSAATVAIAVHRIRYALHHPEEAPRRIADVLTRKLDLSPNQREEVIQLIAVRQEHLQAIRRQDQPAVQAELEGLRHDIDGVLDPEQREKWNDLFDDAIARWLPPPPPPPASGP